MAGFGAQVLQPRMPPGLFKAFTSLLRTANNIIGGMSFVTLAKIVGVQASAGDEKKFGDKAYSDDNVLQPKKV